METNNSGPESMVLNLRAAIFILFFIGIFFAGFWLNGYGGEQIILGISIFLLIIPVMAAQAYYNGSWVLTLLLSPTPILGFWVPTTEIYLGPELYFKLFIAVTVGWMLGLTGHLIGVVLAKRDNRPLDHNNLITYSAAALLFLLSILYLL
jgi:hypothetical protein